MKFKFILVITVIIFTIFSFIFAIELNDVNVSNLESKVEKILNKTNVSRRPDADKIFLLAEIYQIKGQLEKAKKLYIEGLKINSWNMYYQLKFAKLLKEMGNIPQAIQKAKLVKKYTENEELMLEANKILNKNELFKTENSNLSSIQIVVVPIGDIDERLIHEVIKELKNIIDVNYYLSEEYIDPGDIDRSLYQKKIQNINLYEQAIIRLYSFLPEYESKIKDLKNNGQYDASKLMEKLEDKFKNNNNTKIKGYIGMLDSDIYANNYNYLFGWSKKGYSIVSYYRFKSSFTNELPNRVRLKKRIIKQLVSSTLLIFGIPRCSSVDCIRAYPNNLEEHDLKNLKLCNWCEERLNDYIKNN